MREELNKILAEGTEEITSATDLKLLDEIRVKYLGKAGKLTQILRGMKDVLPEERREIGSLANKVREKIEAFLTEKLCKLENDKLLSDM